MMTPGERRALALTLFDSRVAPHWEWDVLPTLGEAGRDAIRTATGNAAAGGKAEDDELMHTVFRHVTTWMAGPLHTDCKRVVTRARM